ncbi:MAG: hypothetical protein MUF15_28700, partial [Acidobacteria bacterium]|nr:hypothetical protein [Acidobacteriota bacterium]
IVKIKILSAGDRKKILGEYPEFVLHETTLVDRFRRVSERNWEREAVKEGKSKRLLPTRITPLSMKISQTRSGKNKQLNIS